MARIFISYRRDDSADAAGRLAERLRQHFPQSEIFLDISSIKPGVDFAEVIKQEVSTCDALIVVIGKQWLSLTDVTGRRRLDDPDDFVRLEVATALKRNIPVIPVLVSGTSMPQAHELPPDLRTLAKRQYIEIRHTTYNSDVQQLVLALVDVPNILKQPIEKRGPSISDGRGCGRLSLLLGLGVIAVVIFFVVSFVIPQITSLFGPSPLKTTVNNLQRGSNSFAVVIENEADQVVRVPIYSLSVSDDKGNSYEFDRSAMFGTGLSKTVPPRGNILINYTLTSPIDGNATRVIFTLEDVWITRGAFSNPVSTTTWAVNLP